MPVKRFDEAFHASMINTYVSWCGLAFKFQYLFGEVASHRSVKMVNGTMLHRAIELIHGKELFDADEAKLRSLIRDSWRYAEFEDRNSDVPVYWDDDKEEQKQALTEEALTILQNYIQFPANRKCKVLLTEAEFKVGIGDKTIYPFEGRIDQLREEEDGKLNLVDWKSGQTVPGDTEMRRGYQFFVYAAACRDGVFTDKYGNKIKICRTPDLLTHYQLRDHLEYAKPYPVKLLEDRGNNLTTSYRNWFVDIAETYTPEEIRELTGNNRLNAKNKVYFPAGHQRGPGMHIARLTDHRMKVMTKCITYACASIRLNQFMPNPGACSSCRFADTCDIFLDGIDKPKFMSDSKLRKVQKEYAELL